MADWEKILIWLEKCHGICNENTDCDLCPFSEAGTYDYSCAEQLENAIRRELMKKQEPTKTKASAAEPIKRVWSKSIEYVCSACSHRVGLKHRERDTWYFRDDECTKCGRSVKWDD